jgi:hypothetical protein
MHSPAAVAEVLALRATGLGARRIARQTDLPLATVRDWLAGKVPQHSRNGGPVRPSCAACGQPEHRFAELPSEYVYLLGLYLGDGCISAHPRGVFRMRVFLDLRYSTIIEDCEAAVGTLVPWNKVHRLAKCSSFTESDGPSYVEVSAFSKCWPCLFPQHGPGKKYERSIVLTDWQLELVARWPEQLVRGLIHSDGCRFQNTGRGGWSHPRYSFTQVSDDIRGIFCHACDLMGLHWTRAGERTIYISRVADVAKLDQFIGPKR